MLFTAAVVVLAPRGVQAQSYFAPLVTPPASVGSCTATRTVAESRPDATPFTGHRLVIPGVQPGERRQITVFVNARHAMLYDDRSIAMARQLSGITADVLANIDTLGQVHGRRLVGRSSFADNVPPMPRDSATSFRMREQAMTQSSQAPLSAAEQARVRQMASWLLKRCP